MPSALSERTNPRKGIETITHFYATMKHLELVESARFNVRLAILRTMHATGKAYGA